MKSSSKKNRNNSEDYYSFTDIKPLNFIQGEYQRAINSNDIIFGTGSAGTGKTYIAGYYAAHQLYYKKINKIILTRPNIETGPSLGFLPGTLEEKYQPYLDPFIDVFTKALGTGMLEYCLKTKQIEPKPLGFMRGSTFENCVVLADEMQNASVSEIKMLLSRIGRNCKMILSGDPDQTDIRNSGLLDAIHRLQGIAGIEHIKFLDDDIVRSKLCKQIILAYK